MSRPRMSRPLSDLLPVTPDSLADMVGVAVIGVTTVALLWLPAVLSA